MKPWSQEISSVGGQLVDVGAGLRWPSINMQLMQPHFSGSVTPTTATREKQRSYAVRRSASANHLERFQNGYYLYIMDWNVKIWNVKIVTILIGNQLSWIWWLHLSDFGDQTLQNFAAPSAWVLPCGAHGHRLPEIGSAGNSSDTASSSWETSRNCKFFTLGNFQLYQLSVFQIFFKFSQATFRNFQTCYLEMDTYGYLWIPVDFPRCVAPLLDHCMFVGMPKGGSSAVHHVTMLWKMEYDSIEITSLSLVFRLELHFFAQNLGFRRMFQSI